VELYLIIAVGTVAAIQLAAGYLIVQQQRVVDRLDDRLTHLTAGISLLTDTTEGGLRDVAQEVNRLGSAAAPAPRARAATQRRIASAARRGRTVQEIATTEKVSEGEVMLRLQLADHSPRHRAHDGR
jgi:hypothetical protein